ncbi:MAG: hypothetical protein ACXWZL_11055 [Mycobacterium sp.]
MWPREIGHLSASDYGRIERGNSRSGTSVSQARQLGSSALAPLAGTVLGVGRPAGFNEVAVAAPVGGQQLVVQLVVAGVAADDTDRLPPPPGRAPHMVSV